VDLNSINDFLAHLAGQGVSLLEPIVAVGVLVMAIIQTLKDLLPIRRIFQRRFLRTWLATQARGAPVSPLAAEADLVRLATAGDSNSFFDLPIEQLCGQMNAGMQLALDYPKKHEELLRLMAASAEASDIDRVVESWEADSPRLDDLTPPEKDALIQARARVAHATQRAIDGLQIAAGNRWKLLLQIAAFSLSFLITTFAALSGAAAWPAASAVLYGLLGGFLAPVARDLLASLQQVPRRP
jgi:hypothetical protein